MAGAGDCFRAGHQPQQGPVLQEQTEAMNASMKVMTPEQKWHAGRQADAFFGLLDQYNQLLEEHNKLKAYAGLCDEPDCYDSVCCGTPTPDGYRNTCYEHKPDKGP